MNASHAIDQEPKGENEDRAPSVMPFDLSGTYGSEPRRRMAREKTNSCQRLGLFVFCAARINEEMKKTRTSKCGLMIFRGLLESSVITPRASRSRI